MVYLLLTCLLLVIAVLVHSFSAWLQRRFKFYAHLGPTAWATHQFVIAPAWLVFFVLSTQISNFIFWPMPLGIPGLGWILLGISILLMISSIKVIGLQALTNGWLFDDHSFNPHRRGIYRYLVHPFYDGLALAYVAAAFISNNAAYLAIAGLLHVLLNHLQARLDDIADSLVK